ncbi:KH domain-containing protein HEN4 isoform X2 [Daucus carota subsp. sativus]|uniref:KH domain-containing protein HEN4 isoform X2 n=1 Tax=Daucus carota subsp. sativus TaxID=79200 RepID=UPI0007EF6380|nr:PREDICTED: KH domain-containing protein At4g18375-like isoform X2 [Daucus carota subsp. sativus]
MEDPYRTTTIRLLCNTKTAGGVIGHLGHYIKQLVRTTGAKIKLQEPHFKCCERVISVTGTLHQDRSIMLGGEKWKMSQLQEALLRVFERVLEMEGSEREIVGCRVLAGPGQVAGVIGVAGSVITKIEKRCGTKIRIFSTSQLQGCADAGDELIQITGEAVAVKQTLLAVSWRLQEMKPRGVVLNHMSSEEKGRVLVSQEYTSKVVTYRLLCSRKVAGGLIGVGGGLVKCLEVETGASIRISKPLATPTERIATITARESPESFPSAQNAVMRIFSRSVELDNEMDPGSSLHTERAITAQLIVDSNQVSFLLDSEGMISSDIRNTNGVEMQLSWGSIVEKNAAKSDYILQISGLYENVRNALLQVTSRLRNLFFSTIISNAAEHVQNCCSVDSNFTSSDREKAVYCGSDDLICFSSADPDMNITLEMNRLGFLNEPVEGYETKDLTDTSGGFRATEIDLEKGSVEFAVSTNSIEVFEVPEQALNCIYGERGSNLSRMKQISGASIVVEDPCAGKSYRNVIISGTLHSIMVARSLLQAFVLPQL